MKNQKQQILELLQEGWHLSKLQILDKIGALNSGARIHELRNNGHNIKTTMVTHKVTGKEFAVYSLDVESKICDECRDDSYIQWC